MLCGEGSSAVSGLLEEPEVTLARALNIVADKDVRCGLRSSFGKVDW